jgi:hypothetical protein
MNLTLEEIRQARQSLRRESIEVPELGGSVLLRVLTLREVEEIKRAQKPGDDPLKIYPKLVAAACVNDDGSQLFAGEDARLVSELPWPAVDAIARAVIRINGMSGKEE